MAQFAQVKKPPERPSHGRSRRFESAHLHSQVSCSAVSATPRVASRRVVVGSGGRVVQEGDHLRLIGLRVEVPALDVSRPGAAHELDLGD